jgi:hypothetical protein
MLIPAPIEKDFVPYGLYRRPGRRAGIAHNGSGPLRRAYAVPQTTFSFPCGPADDCLQGGCSGGQICYRGGCVPEWDPTAAAYCRQIGRR